MIRTGRWGGTFFSSRFTYANVAACNTQHNTRAHKSTTAQRRWEGHTDGPTTYISDVVHKHDALRALVHVNNGCVQMADGVAAMLLDRLRPRRLARIAGKSCHALVLGRATSSERLVDLCAVNHVPDFNLRHNTHTRWQRVRPAKVLSNKEGCHPHLDGVILVLVVPVHMRCGYFRRGHVLLTEGLALQPAKQRGFPHSTHTTDDDFHCTEHHMRRRGSVSTGTHTGRNSLLYTLPRMSLRCMPASMRCTDRFTSSPFFPD